MSQDSCPASDTMLKMLAGTLQQSELAALETHLGECGRCQQQLESLAAGVRVPDSEDIQPPSSTLRLAMERLTDSATHAEPMPTGDQFQGEANELAPLIASFDPCDNPDALGMLGVYEVHNVIGQGGMGVVVSAIDTKLHREVAIKIPNQKILKASDYARRFLREARSIAALRHQNIVLLYTIDEVNGMSFHVMELIKGSSLHELVAAGKRMDFEEALRVASGVAAALQAAHRVGIIHRDIKPANILLESSDGTIKVTDFGLAKSKDDAAVTDSGVLLGTPEFMSPEQVTGGELTTKSDLFSLGAVLYRLSSGVSPFRKQTSLETMNAVCGARPKALREINRNVPGWYSDLVGRLLAKSPADRPSSAEYVVEALRTRTLPAEQPLPQPEKPKEDVVEARAIWKGVVFAAFCFIGFGVAIGYVTFLNLTKDKDGESTLAPVAHGPFVDAADGSSFADFATAVDALENDGVLEVRGDGPFPVSGIELVDKSITIRAADSFRPVFKITSVEKDAFLPFIQSNRDVKLEGLDIRWSLKERRLTSINTARQQSVIQVDDSLLSLKNCRVTTDFGCCVAVKNGSMELENSHLVSEADHAIIWIPQSEHLLHALNCVVEASRSSILMDSWVQDGSNKHSTIRISNNYFRSRRLLIYLIEAPSRRFELFNERNIIDTTEVLTIMPGESQVPRNLTPFQRKRFVTQRFDWRESHCRYRGGTMYLTRGRLERAMSAENLVETISNWFRLFNVANRDSTELPVVQVDEEALPGPFDAKNPWVRLTLHKLPEAAGAGPDLERVGPPNGPLD